MINKKTYLAILLMLFIFNKPGNSMEFMEDINARPMSMGSAYTALAEGVAGVYANPAGQVWSVRNPELSTSYAKNFEEVTQYHLATGLKLSDKWLINGNLAFNFAGSLISDIPLTSFNSEGRPEVTDYFDSSKQNTTVTYANKLTNNLSYGINFKNYNYRILHTHAAGKGTDVGLLYRNSIWKDHAINLGVCAKNIGNTKIFWDTGYQDEIRESMVYGLAVQTKLWVFPLTISADLEKVSLERDIARSGLEFWFLPQAFCIRAGNDDGQATVGTGFYYDGFHLDYAQVDNEDLGFKRQVSMGWEFASAADEYIPEEMLSEKLIIESTENIIIQGPPEPSELKIALKK
ncbi:hypothetical protein ACFL5G_05260 [Candidatus Margulisiibacteriota bacterium]